MWLKPIILSLIVILLNNGVLFAQNPVVNVDSTKIYSKIESYSQRRVFTKFMFPLIFKSTKPVLINKKVVKKRIQTSPSAFDGKIIRFIQIETLDPFGRSIEDTSTTDRNFLLKTSNRLHVKSQAITVRNLLLIKQNQKFDALRVKESERLVRSMSYVRDVSFVTKEIGKNADSVDIFIRFMDNWSITPEVSSSATGTTVNLTDNNFVGLGHEFQAIYNRNYTNGTNGYAANYSILNFKNSYIGSKLNYEIDGNKNVNAKINLFRPFFSPLTKWAAGASVERQFRNDTIAISNSIAISQRFKRNTQDLWAGYSIQLYKGNSDYVRTTNIISAVRFLRVRYLEKPIEAFDFQHYFNNENFYLASIGISTREYVKDKSIFRFGITEVVPIGKVLSMTYGYQEIDNGNRFYLGARASFGNYHTWGYLGTNFEYGSFYSSSKAEQRVVEVGANYFTSLFEIGKWKFRQFAKPRVTIGINRLSSDSLTINDGYGLDGFQSPSLFGTSRLLLALQTQAYAPWNFIGFRFGPYFIYSIGMLGNAPNGFRDSKLYSQFGLGVLIRNENLVINTFQISIAFYPIIPDKGHNIIKLNSFKTTDFGFRDFEIGKPSTVAFR